MDLVLTIAKYVIAIPITWWMFKKIWGIKEWD